jgi:hypothetical protein
MLARTPPSRQSQLSQTNPPEISLADSGAEPNIVGRLHAIGVDTCAEWRRLGKQRFRIFGITTVQASRLDELVRDALQKTQAGR